GFQRGSSLTCCSGAVSVGLFLSDLDLALRLSVLTSRNITLIINSSGLENVSYPLLDGLQVLHVPIQDQPHTPLRQCFDHVAEQITQNQTRTTLVHCTAGRSRSPALIMACLKVSASVKQVIEQRPFIRPNAGFWRQLMDYERALFGRNIYSHWQVTVVGHGYSRYF
uniref:Tyrosine-protein phosphatase domain-containing protein n=1 Tax=Echeneis naucrates TaxID=173247 RepID=A0A665UJ80_ECHNA